MAKLKSKISVYQIGLKLAIWLLLLLLPIQIWQAVAKPSWQVIVFPILTLLALLIAFYLRTILTRLEVVIKEKEG